MSSSVPTVLKWHGGKGYLAKRLWDIALSTDWRPIHVVEPYCGGASFTLEGLARELPFSFVINDLSGELTNFWRCLQSREAFAIFSRVVNAMPFSEAEFKDAMSNLVRSNAYADVDAAIKFFIKNRMSLAGRMKSFTGVTKTRTRRKMNNEVSAWLTCVDGLPEFHSLLRKVLILDARKAIKVIENNDGHDTLFYLDPPYMHETRRTTEEYGINEMSKQEHGQLVGLINGCRSHVMISGYRSELYDSALASWNRHDFDLPNNAASGKEKRRMTETCWTNF